MRKILIPILFIFILTGCNKEEVKTLIRTKHAQAYVFIERLNNPDVTKRPTDAEKDEFIKACAKDYESLDRVINNWKSTGGSAMKPVDVDGNKTNE
jgi:hypothetical protein